MIRITLGCYGVSTERGSFNSPQRQRGKISRTGSIKRDYNYNNLLLDAAGAGRNSNSIQLHLHFLVAVCITECGILNRGAGVGITSFLFFSTWTHSWSKIMQAVENFANFEET